MSLESLGWDPFFEGAFKPHAERGFEPARVLRQDRGAYLTGNGADEWIAELPGSLVHRADPGDLPAVGDWVAVELPAGGRARVRAVLPRRTRLSRKAAGRRTDEQVVAANVDVVFVVGALDGGRNLNLRRFERCLAAVYDSGAEPVIVLNKSDLAGDPGACVREAEPAARGAPVLAVSAVRGEGLEALRARLGPGRTGTLIGPSGVGKSTLVNAMLGREALDTGGVREDDRRGRHTTTRRELLLLPGGGCLIDTPGLRELQLWGDDSDLAESFDDVEAAAEQCRFRDCSHSGEPGCGVDRAIADGRLDPARYESFLKLKRELSYLLRRRDLRARLEERDRWKKITRDFRQRKRQRKG